MTTEPESKLLTSGWWGVFRHPPNYSCVACCLFGHSGPHLSRGDLLMTLAWSFDTPLTYFSVVYSQCSLFKDSDGTMKDVRIGK